MWIFHIIRRVTVCVFVLTVHESVALQNSDQYFNRALEMDNVIALDNPVINMNPVGKLQCASICARNITYESFGFNSISHTCVIFKTSIFTKGSQENGWQYYTKANATPSVLSQCRNGWMKNNGSCYLFKLERKPWTEAMVECEKYGATLAEVSSPSENEFLKSIIEILGYGFWVGGSDAEVEGVWKWVSSNVSLTFADWKTGEPNNYGNEDCIEFKNNWNDNACEEGINYICEENKEN